MSFSTTQSKAAEVIKVVPMGKNHPLPRVIISAVSVSCGLIKR